MAVTPSVIPLSRLPEPLVELWDNTAREAERDAQVVETTAERYAGRSGDPAEDLTADLLTWAAQTARGRADSERTRCASTATTGVLDKAVQATVDGRPLATCQHHAARDWFDLPDNVDPAEHLDEVRRRCGGCPLRVECTQLGIQYASHPETFGYELHGIWGGHTDREIYQLALGQPATISVASTVTDAELADAVCAHPRYSRSNIRTAVVDTVYAGEQRPRRMTNAECVLLILTWVRDGLLTRREMADRLGASPHAFFQHEDFARAISTQFSGASDGASTADSRPAHASPRVRSGSPRAGDPDAVAPLTGVAGTYDSQACRELDSDPSGNPRVGGRALQGLDPAADTHDSTSPNSDVAA